MKNYLPQFKTEVALYQSRPEATIRHLTPPRRVR